MLGTRVASQDVAPTVKRRIAPNRAPATDGDRERTGHARHGRCRRTFGNRRRNGSGRGICHYGGAHRRSGHRCGGPRRLGPTPDRKHPCDRRDERARRPSRWPTAFGSSVLRSPGILRHGPTLPVRSSKVDLDEGHIAPVNAALVPSLDERTRASYTQAEIDGWSMGSPECARLPRPGRRHHWISLPRVRALPRGDLLSDPRLGRRGGTFGGLQINDDLTPIDPAHFPDGTNCERTRDLGHVSMGLGAWMHGARTIRAQGDVLEQEALDRFLAAYTHHGDRVSTYLETGTIPLPTRHGVTAGARSGRPGSGPSPTRCEADSADAPRGAPVNAGPHAQRGCSRLMRPSLPLRNSLTRISAALWVSMRPPRSRKPRRRPTASSNARPSWGSSPSLKRASKSLE